MTYQEEEQVGERWRRSKQAIALAMEGRWEEAIAANQGLIELFPNDVNAYNRLGRAYMEWGEYGRAEEAYRRAMDIDPYNMIAKRNLGRLSHLGEAAVGGHGDSDKVEPQQFVEETGKAGLVSLYDLASPKVLAQMSAGDKVYVKVNGGELQAENAHKERLGRVEPAHERRLMKLMDGGNRYSAAIVTATDEGVTIIIRETHQDPSQGGRSSFPAKEFKSPRPYITDRARREIEEFEEEEGEPGYTIVGGAGVALSPEESAKLELEGHNAEEEEETEE